VGVRFVQRCHSVKKFRSTCIHETPQIFLHPHPASTTPPPPTTITAPIRHSTYGLGYPFFATCPTHCLRYTTQVQRQHTPSHPLPHQHCPLLLPAERQGPQWRGKGQGQRRGVGRLGETHRDHVPHAEPRHKGWGVGRVHEQHPGPARSSASTAVLPHQGPREGGAGHTARVGRRGKGCTVRAGRAEYAGHRLDPAPLSTGARRAHASDTRVPWVAGGGCGAGAALTTLVPVGAVTTALGQDLRHDTAVPTGGAQHLRHSKKHGWLRARVRVRVVAKVRVKVVTVREWEGEGRRVNYRSWRVGSNHYHHPPATRTRTTTTHSAQRTTHNTQHTTHNAQRTTHNAQRTTHNAQRARHRGQASACVRAHTQTLVPLTQKAPRRHTSWPVR
jgi:hypothetical protein